MFTVSQFDYEYAIKTTRDLVTVGRKAATLVSDNKDKEIFMYWGDSDAMLVKSEDEKETIPGWVVSRTPFLSVSSSASQGCLVNVFMAANNGWLYLIDTEGEYIEPLLTHFADMQDFDDTLLMTMELPQAMMQRLLADALRCYQRLYCRLFRRIADIVP